MRVSVAVVTLRHHVWMEFQLAVSAAPGSHAFVVWVEPEGMAYELPATVEVVLSFRGCDAMRVELSHRPDGLIIWRPADTEVWATTPRRHPPTDWWMGSQSRPWPGFRRRTAGPAGSRHD